MCNGLFGGSNCSWIVILILLMSCCGNEGREGGNGCGCGCGCGN